MRGLAEDGGLFMPDQIPLMPDSFLNQISSFSFPEISFEVSRVLLGDAIPANDLKKLSRKQ
jgi:threonine synthase